MKTAAELKTLPVLAELRDYQNAFMEDVMRRLDDGEPGSFLYAAPTGSGKSVMELTLLGWLPDAVLVTPRLEIVADMLRKGGVNPDGWGDERLAREALEHRITTPVRLRNMLAKGEFPWRPTAVIWDEAHHRAADSYEDVRAYLGGGIAEIGLTATPFRGTPAGTEAFLNSWTDLTWVLTYPDAAARGVIAVPRCEVWPLVDDDEIEVTNGEIVVRAAGEAVQNVLDGVVERCGQFRRVRTLPDYGGRDVAYPCWDRPTIFAVPTTACATDLAARLTAAGLPAAAVTQDTPRADRVRIFRECEAGEVAVVQIDVVSEGVDLKLRRLVDLRPTMSPVKWLQQVGRVTRPTRRCKLHAEGRDVLQGCLCEPAPEYVCCNRNLERHCYLYDGLVPPAAVAAAQQAFARPSRRAGARAVGVEGLGRFAASELPLADGCTGFMYQLTTVEGFTKREYAVLLHPCSSQPLYAARENARAADGQTVAWGRWRPVDRLPDLTGFGSAPAKSVSEKQLAWWKRSAGRLGLDPAAEPNRRNFAALPVLTDLGVKLATGV